MKNNILDNKRFFNEQLSKLDNFENFDDLNFDDLNADAAAETAVPQKSRPYIVTLQNSTGVAVSNVTFINPIGGLRENVFNSGVNAGIVVSYGYANTTYEDFLRDILTAPARIYQTYIFCGTSEVQLLESIEHTTKNSTGSSQSMTLNPIIDPYQNRGTAAIIEDDFILDRFTTLTLASLAATTTVKFMFYPFKVTSATKGLVGQSATRTLAPAKISIATK